MNCVFFTNYVLHHQIPWADEMYRLLGGDFHYVELCPTEDLVKAMSGYSVIERPYVLKAYENDETKSFAFELATKADVMIWGGNVALPYVKARAKSSAGITFEMGERWLKKGILNLLSPNLLQNKWIYHTKLRWQNAYRLCSSAYAQRDEKLLLSYKGKCLKWGYFTAAPDLDIETTIASKRTASTVKILWVARFLQWKHPDRMPQLACQLQKRGVDFHINMIGVGPEHDKIQQEIKTLGLEKFVSLLGTMPNEDVLAAMRTHHIFCFTSDKNEGWGAVLNEAMANGCCPVSSIETGSTPYLIHDGVNGFSFDANVKDDFVNKVHWLITHPEEREQMSIAAYKTIHDIWSPKSAALRLCQFCDSILNHKTCDAFADGPCSHA